MKMTQSKVNKHIIDQQALDQRIDNFLIKKLKGLPKSRIYRALRKGEVRVNGGRVKADYKLQAGDEVRVPPLRVSAPKERQPIQQSMRDELESRILHENDEMIVINKPAGLAVHGGSRTNTGVVEWLRMMRPTAKAVELVHRLDKDTSGVLLLAKKRKSLLAMQSQFAERQVSKVYRVVVAGAAGFERKQVDVSLLRLQNETGARKVVVSRQGKSAITQFKVLKRGQQISCLQAKILTGRMHQIRVHAAHLGLPIVGDQRYGDWTMNRQFDRLGAKRMYLHAEFIELTIAGQKQRFEAEPGEEFQSIFQYDGQITAD